MSSQVPLYSRMSVTSKSEIRYEGTLIEVNANNQTLTLAQVRVLGTEGRRPMGEVAPSQQIFPSIIFPGTDIKELLVVAPPPATTVVTPPAPNGFQQNQTFQQPPQTKQPSAFAAAGAVGTGSKPVAPLPTLQPSSAFESTSSFPASNGSAQTPSSTLLPRVAEVSRMSKLFEGSSKTEQQQSSAAHGSATPEKKSPSNANNDTSVLKEKTEALKLNHGQSAKTAKNDTATREIPKASAKQPSPKHEQQQQQPPKKSVFDMNPAGSKRTSVVTVEGLSPDVNAGQVRQLFEDQSGIVSVKVVALPSGKTAADIVFSDLDAASQAVATFSHPGLSASHMSTPSMAPPRTRRVNDSKTFGSISDTDRSKKSGPPQVRSGPPTVNDRGGRGGRFPGSTRSKYNDATKSMENASKPDFDFSASNAKFDKSDLVGEVVDGSASSSKGKGFFDDVSMSQNVASAPRQQRGVDIRRKDAETFGAIALSYRSGGGYRGQSSAGGPRGGGGRGRGRGGGRGGSAGGPPRVISSNKESERNASALASETSS